MTERKKKNLITFMEDLIGADKSEIFFCKYVVGKKEKTRYDLKFSNYSLLEFSFFKVAPRLTIDGNNTHNIYT